MNRRSSTCFLLAAVVTLALNCAVNASQPVTAASGASSQLDAILASFPAQAGEEAAELYKKMLDGGKETVKALCSRAAPSSAGNDAAVRFALHGLVHHVARPGADKQRRLVAGALAEALDTAATDDVQDFLLEQLRFVADKSNIPGVSKFLLNAGTADRAVAVLTAIGAPPAERAMLDALPKADPACTATLIQALGDSGSEACVKECANRLDSTNAAVQRAALYALSRSGSSRAGDLLAARRRNPPAGMEADAILAACLDHAERLTQKGEGKRRQRLPRRCSATRRRVAPPCDAERWLSWE